MRLRAIATRSTGIQAEPEVNPIIDDLFGNGEEGCFYDPSDLSTLFQDWQGTIPVTAPGQPVGLMLDKSGRERHAMQTNDDRRPIFDIDDGRPCITFDGATTFLAVPDADYSVTSQVTICVGARKFDSLRDASVVDLMSQGRVTDRSFACYFPLGKPAPSPGASSYGTYWRLAFVPGIPSPDIFTQVITAQTDTIEPYVGVRGNGKLWAEDRDYQGGGTYRKTPLHIGSRFGETFWYRGNIYGLIVRGAKSTDAQIHAVEQYMNTKTKAY